MKSQQKSRIAMLDLFRFLAAFVVVMYHYTFRGLHGHMILGETSTIFNDVFQYGYLGVSFFFMISGFVIPMSLKTSSVKKFLWARFLRLYPQYWVAVLLTSITVLGISGTQIPIGTIVANLTMVHNYFGIQSIDGVYWSLFVELRFYLLVALSLLFCHFFPGAKTLKTPVIATWLLLSILYLLSFPFTQKVVDVLFILEHAPFFISGILFFEMYETGCNKTNTSLLLISGLTSFVGELNQLPFYELKFGLPYSKIHVCFILASMFFVFIQLTRGVWSRLNVPIFMILGSLTYPLYLIHQRIGYLLIQEMAPKLTVSFAIFLVTILMVLLSWGLVLLDKKFVSFVRKIERS